MSETIHGIYLLQVSSELLPVILKAFKTIDVEDANQRF